MASFHRDRRPLALQLRDQIWNEIVQEHYPADTRLPSEQEYAARFGVSRATVREALKILEEERVIVCQHGVGRFLAHNPSDMLSEEITRLQSVTEMVGELGITLKTRVLSVRQELATDVVRDRLGLSREDTVGVLERMRLSDDEPIIYSVDIFPWSIVTTDLDKEELTGSLVRIMEDKWKTTLAYSKATISAVLLDSSLSRQLAVSKHVPWILLEQVNYDLQNRPILYSNDYHRGDKFQFRVLRRRR